MPVRDRLLEFESKRNEFEEKEKKEKTHKRKQKKRKEVIHSSLTALQRRVKGIDFYITLLKVEIIKMQNMFTSISMSDSDITEMKKRESKITCQYTLLMRKIKQLSSATFPVAEQRIKDMQVYKLNYDLRKTMIDFRTSQFKYNEKATTRLNRDRLRMTETDVNECSVFPDTQNQCASIICTDEAHNRIRNLQVLQQQNRAIKGLENDVSELFLLFKEMEELVHDPGIPLDNIERHIQNADAYVINANKELEWASGSRCALKRRRIIWIIIAVIFVAVVIIITSKFILA